ncbi:rhamnose ABC transporter substrate-binding protein [Luteimicrobium xylanilyticum]|uniref:Autoinducer 2-binding protein LsrB n=1 Tax=Luteimicrobium xylanilyticum TaxID=1133546 RepID=A0A5P9Q9S3_9MICO|nr:rhamnose ABC transporter substrate-binding protein [Luteimicrobium xylanilyticum]QFU97165.1 Autoinducer 2-binding protein LsrB [Luteimicrobium xylanilyticum]
MKMHLHRGRRGVSAAVVTAAVLALGLAACSTSSSSSGSTKGGSDHNYKVAFVPKSLGNKYFQASDAGGKDAVEGFGGSYQEVGPTATGANAQVPFIQTLTQQKVGAIVTAANDPQAACSALKQAQQQKIKVVTFDSDTNCRDVFVNQVSSEGIAKTLVDLMGEAIGGTGEIGVIDGGPNATNQNEWLALMKKDLAAKYPNIKLVDVVYGNDDDQDSLNAAKGLVQAHPNLKGIISPDSVGIKNAALYLSQSQYKGKIALTGLGLPSELRQYVKDGTITKFALWDPTNLGYLAAYAAKALIDGDITGKEGDTFTAGKLGKYTVGKDGVIILGDPTVFDKSNIDKYNF